MLFGNLIHENWRSLEGIEEDVVIKDGAKVSSRRKGNSGSVCVPIMSSLIG